MKITKDAFLADILKYPKTREILAKYSLPCLSCPFASQEMENLKIGDICQKYGIDRDKMIEELNRAVAVDKK